MHRDELSGKLENVRDFDSRQRMLEKKSRKRHGKNVVKENHLKQRQCSVA